MAPKKRTTRTSPATTTTTITPVTNAHLKALIDQGIAGALAARDADRSMNDDDNHNSGTGVRRTERVARECTYLDFMKCQPLNFKGTERVIELTQWFEKIETVFCISNCSMENQIMFSTCTLLGSALTWWNSYVRTVGHDVAYAMTWTDLKKKMTDKYCPRSEIKKLEVKIMFPEESDKIERYVSGFPNMIYGSVVASKPKTMQEAIEMETKLMDKKILTFTERQTENKRKQDYNNNQAQQQPPKKKVVAIAYTARPGERKEYVGTLPLCYKCKFHHNGQCTIKFANCKRVGHLTRDCRSPSATNNQRNLTCYECGNQGHYRSDCPKLKNQDHGNQARGTRAHGMVHALGGGETNQDLNDMEDDINA
ncbi:RNA-directed DNA polymerase, eukaryota [Tanacetum coccineum]